MQHRAATHVSLRRSALAARPLYRLLLLLPLLLLVPACGGDTPDAPAAPDSPVEPTVDLARVDTLDEEAEGPEDPAPQDPPVAATPLPPGLPALDAATRKAATEALQPVGQLLEDLLARYATAMEAKRKGDDAGWRAALGEAVALGHEVQDRWNEVIAAMPANDEFDEEETAAHHFPAGHSAVADTLDALRNMERQLGR